MGSCQVTILESFPLFLILCFPYSPTENSRNPTMVTVATSNPPQDAANTPAPDATVAKASDVPEQANAGCPGTTSQAAGKSDSCVGCPNQAACATGEAAPEDPAIAAIASRLSKENVKHKILVLSGKGGVGKSTLAAQMSILLSSQGLDVGLLDVDVCGPSAPHMLGVSDEEVRMSASGWSPVYVEENLAVMSVAFMLPDKSDAVIWRGVRKTSLIKQFLRDVDWGDTLDFLIVDAPPGTSDEHISLVQFLKKADIDGAIIVTTPQEVSLLDVRKEISFCRKSGTRVLGVVENMSGFVCPSCKECTQVFFPSSGGAEKMCSEMDVPFLGRIPLDPNVSKAGEMGKSMFENEKDSPAVLALSDIVGKLRKKVGHTVDGVNED